MNAFRLKNNPKSYACFIFFRAAERAAQGAQGLGAQGHHAQNQMFQNFKCDYCGDSKNSKQELERHRTNVHGLR